MSRALLTAVPAPPARLLGRERELEAISRALADGALVTLWGPPGVGKTTLACAAVRRLRSSSVGYVDLARARSQAELTELVALALALEVPPGESAAVATIARALDAHESPLLVLDNAEVQAVAVGALVSACLARARDLRFLVASRQRLAIREELALEVSPLPVPAAGDDPSGSAAMQILARHLPDDALDDRETREVLAWICRRLDGVPLALEMVAARLRATSPQALRAELETSLAPLAAGVQNPNPRQGDWAATMAWSWNLLPAAEQRALALLSTFAATFTSERASAVMEVDRATGGDLVGALRDRSLLVQVAPDRFRLLELVRDFAALRLEELAIGEAARARHAMEAAREVADLDLVAHLTKHRPDVDWLLELAPDLRAALASVESSPGGSGALLADLLVGQSPIVLATGPFAAACEKLERLLEAPDVDDGRRAKLQLLLGLMRLRLGQAAPAAAAFDAAISSADAMPDALVATAMLLRAEAGAYLGEAELLERTRAALDVAVRSGQREVESYAHLGAAQRCLDAGRLEEARQHVADMNRRAATTWAAWHVWGTTVLSFDELPPLVGRDRIERALEHAPGRDRGFLLKERATYEAHASLLDRAEETLRRSMSSAAQAGDLKLEWSALGQAGLLDLRAGELARADSRLAHVLSLGRLVPRERAGFEQGLRAARILLGADPGAAAAVPADLGPGRVAAARLYAALGETVRRLRQTSRSEVPALLRDLSAEVAPVLGTLGCEPLRFEARLALDTLRAWLLRIPAFAGRADLGELAGEDLTAGLAIARDGSCIWRLGRPVAGQKLVHRLLGALLAAHLRGESAVSSAALYRAGWGEELSTGSERQRLRVAMSKLRKHEVPVEHDDDGYRLTFVEPPLVV